MLGKLDGVHPQAPTASMLRGPHHRITVLDAGLVRLEYSESGEFEDRASQTVINRDFPGCEFQVSESDDLLELHTARLHLTYDKRPFSTEGLSVQAKGGFHSTGSVWRFGLPTLNLGGTARTLDEVDGACPLEPGVLSREGITVIDDSTTLLLDETGWLDTRRPGTRDLYVFAFGRDYKEALRALYRLTGPQPLLPRYALGNWWSRYHPYSAEEYLALMDRFHDEDVPLSVAVLDMDWHWVDIDPRFGSGWTGYTWNTELFPDPPKFLAELHRRGLRTSLNVHPAEGVHAHEKAYPTMAKRLGIDPGSELPVPFDASSPSFLDAYFEELHHPLEDDGVDLWWLDWQQGGVTKLAGLDPLWLLNHFHYLDSGRSGRRPLTFSRYAGVGSHRYPIGFSGDTVVTWASLDFQPYFTATASNIGYGWWSHDIGGHFFGAKDDELATRWVQLGVFSPITRLHSSNSLFNTKEPWRFGEQAERIMKSFLRLRHQLLPYLYTMNRRAHRDGEPLVQPMYYDHPDDAPAYEVPNQFMFGDQLLVVPITTPLDPSTRLGEVVAWLPPGQWIDVFTGMTYRGGRRITLHRPLDTIPVLAPAGAVLPLVPADRVQFGTANPDALEIAVFAGASGEFVVAEDSDDARWAETTIRFDPDAGELCVEPVTGDPAAVPATRRYEFVVHGCSAVTSAERVLPGGAEQLRLEPAGVPGSVRITVPDVAREVGVRVRLAGELGLRANPDVRARAFALLDRAQLPYALKEQVYGALDDDLAKTAGELVALGTPAALQSALLELYVADAAG